MQINQINHSYKELDELIRSLWNEKDKRKSLDIGIKLANEVMRLMGIPEDELETGDAVLDRAFSNARFKNQKMENWFEKHPYFGNGRVALNHYNKNTYPVESHLYQLNESATKARISAVSQLSTNWEDSELTMLPDYNVGLDFFLNSKADSLLVVVSKEGNLRVLELSEKLSKTQIEIFKKLDKCFHYTGIDPKTGERIKYEPQRTIHQSIWNAFELKEVNKQFYLGIANQFELLIQYLKQNVPEGLENENIDHSARLFASRLIGRIIFIWFLRKKNIINEKIGYFDTDKLSGTQYYEQKLKPLFFQTLNTPIDKRITEDKLTPYLNGGLFEAHKNDWTEYKINFPVNWFNKLYDHLNSFNFTTDESSPEYEVIAIDPEMLGRVFENLLASIVPETEKAANERNNKGAFYTPREIVTFMCKESLKQYIKTKLDNPKDNQGVDRLIDMNDAQFLEHRSTGMSELWGNRTTEVKKKIIEALNNFKMLDPACGSGAFPMGMLHLLVKTFDRLTAVYDKQIDKHRSAKANEKINVYDTKLFIINKMIYGSDIEPMAIEISRLRAWLSLIIDTEKISQVEPLPNLDFNFVCANSLIPLEETYQVSMFEDPDLEEKLFSIKDKFFEAYTLKEKQKIKEDFKDLYRTKVEGAEDSKRVKQLKSWEPFESDKPADFYDSQIMCSVNKFDLIIGNPPYIHFESIKDASKSVYKPLGYNTYSARGDIYTLFYEMGINNLKKDGILTYITSNKWLRANYGEPLRNYFIKNTNPLMLIDLGSDVFESATVDTSILLLKKQPYDKTTRAVSLYDDDQKRKPLEKRLKEAINIEFKMNQPWVILSEIELNIKEKIEKQGVPLGEIPGIKINRGILTGLNEAFIIDKKTRENILANCKSKNEKDRTEELIRPVLRGKDLKKGKYNWRGLYLITTHNGYKKQNGEVIKRIEIEDYPSIKNHLDKYYEQLKNRIDRGDTPYNLRNCAYLNEFKKDKIYWSDIATEPSFVLVEDLYYINNTAYMITGIEQWMVDYLNSSIIKWYFPLIATTLGNKSTRYFKQFVKKIPIPKYYDEEGLYNYYNFSEKEIEFLDNF